MPAKPRWLLQIPEMIEQLRGLEVPVVDRAVVERTFGVRRRRAVELMRRFGGYLSGNTILLDLLGLIYQLEAVGAGADVIRERRRKERLSGKLDELHRYRAAAAVRIPLPPDTAGRMPEGVASLAAQETAGAAEDQRRKWRGEGCPAKVQAHHALDNSHRFARKRFSDRIVFNRLVFAGRQASMPGWRHFIWDSRRSDGQAQNTISGSF